MTETATPPLRILAWTALGLGNGVFHYRINAPFTEAQWQGLARVDVVRHLDGAVAATTDVIVVPAMLLHAVPEVMRWLEDEFGKDRPLVVIDNDDHQLRPRQDSLLWTAEASYEDYMATYVPRNREGLRMADLVTVSVPPLREAYLPETDTPIVVLPNTVDEVLLQVPQTMRQPGEQLRVGWAGSPSHFSDWRNCAAGVGYGLRRAGAHLIMMGADFRPLVGHKGAEYLPWANSMDEYYLPITTWHVALAPLVDDEFNRCKSPIKALEAGALGVPIVASAAGPYLDYVRHGETGFLCRTQDDWMRALRALANDEEMRRAMGASARELAAHFTTQAWAPRWIEAYRTALDARRSVVV